MSNRSNTIEIEQREDTNSEAATPMETNERSDPGTEPPEEVPITLDDLFEVLKNQRRRRVIRYLGERDEPVSLSDLSESIAAMENDKPVSQLTSQERKRVYVGLYQVHLPKMAGMEFIEYDKGRGMIARGRATHYAEAYLQHAESKQNTWSTYYIGVAGFGWLLLLGSLTSNLLAPTVAAVGFLAILTGIVVTHVYRTWGESDLPTLDAADVPA